MTTQTVGPPPNGSHGFHGFGEYPFCAECRAEKAEEAKAREAENAADIDRLTCNFANDVDEALAATFRTRQAVAALVSDQVYDIELAEGASGADALAELDTALRALRNAKRISDWRRSIALGG